MINDMEGTFKCFWDGSLSLIKDAVYASNFNKTAV